MTKIKPNVVRGGKATNIGGNLYYMNGRKHSQGGIDIGKNPKTGLEVEDGEIVETRPDSLRVFSAQPIINGNSPAKLVMGGANPDKVFQAQETFKDVNGINDDGSKKRMSGKVKIRRRTNTEIDEELGLVPNKNRKAAGGFVTVNGNVIDKLVGDVPFPSPTGGRKKAALGTDKRDKDYVVMNGQLYQVTNDEFGETAYLPVDERTPNSRLLDGRGAAARKSDRQVRAAAKRDAKASVANSSIPKGNNFIEPFNPVQYRATGNSAGSRSKNNSGSNRGFTVRRGSYDTRYPDASSYARDAAAQRKQVTDAASRDAKGARTDFRNMLEVPEFTPGTYSGGNRNTGTRSTNSAPQTRVTPIEEAPATTAATKTSKPATSSAPRRRSGSSKTTKTSATATPTAAPKFASLDSMMQGLPTLSRNTPTTIPTRTVDGASTNAGVPDTISSPRKRLALFDKLDTNDIIGLGANLAGTIASGINTRKALNKMEAPPQPNPVIASNLKTDFNISPQLGEIEENARRMVTDINANTSSSRTRLQRLQRTRNQAQNYKNSLRGQKENIETQLINQDRLNKQGVRATNVAAMNDWQNRSAAFRNSIREQKASSLNNVFSGINVGLQDMLSRIENRRNYNNTLGIYDATHPNVDRRLFTSKGVTF
jgi:hypothetical protein|uniref:Uncharacterized protein n=1 Tax=CrAss-like virus sp. ctUXy6 TaxID=2825835 RepID=A0A8S5V782_9CAUD|nr:MAG TPA: hypothetical protein [CrAss-like virus sp. ctUXy6]